MTEIIAVTTFNKEGLDLYGQHFLDTWCKNTDTDMRLLVYTENCEPKNPQPNKILLLDQKESLPKLAQFKKKWGKEPKANGKCPNPEKRPRDYDKKFKWDAIRFSNKVYAIFDACENHPDSWIVWIDADMVVHSKWKYDDYKKLFPDNTWITYVGRGKGSQTWPECGFYGINGKNAIAQQFMAEFEYMYEYANDGIFNLDEWHDSYVFGDLLNRYLSKGHTNVFDYSANMYLREAKTGGGGHPLINSVLGTWLDHLKGDRKQVGKSKKQDLMVKRGEKYWKF
jgi:hypothetical protein